MTIVIAIALALLLLFNLLEVPLPSIFPLGGSGIVQIGLVLGAAIFVGLSIDIYKGF